jgi:hypothetical protein
MNDIDTRALVDRIKALEAKEAARTPPERKPPTPHNPFAALDGLFREVPQWQRDAAAAVPTSMVQSIVGDNIRSRPSAPPPAIDEKPSIGVNGWLPEVPLRQPEGLRYVDAIAQHFAPMPPKQGG